MKEFVVGESVKKKKNQLFAVKSNSALQHLSVTDLSVSFPWSLV